MEYVSLGDMCLLGYGCPRDSKKACSLGVAEAHFSLGLMYHRGLGVTKHIPTTIKHLEVAVRSGVSAAGCLLATMYRCGDDVKQSNGTSAYWLRQAKKANRKSPDTMRFN